MHELINPARDVESISSQISAAGFVQIHGYLPETTADRFHSCIDKQVQWNLAYSDRGHGKQIKAQQLSTLPPAQILQVVDPACAEDTHTSEGREVAYILNLTKNWRPKPLIQISICTINY